MKQKNVPEANYKTIRSRLTGVVVVPSAILLLMWALFSSYTVFDGFYLRAVASGVKDASIPAVQTFAALQKERELSMTSLSQSGSDTAALSRQRQRTDVAVSSMKTAFAELAAQAPPEIVERINVLNGLLDQLAQRRAQIESGNVSKPEIYGYYNSLLDGGNGLFSTQARIVPDAESVQAALGAVQYFQSADLMSRAGSVAAGALAAGRFTPEEHREFTNLVGAYHSSLASIEPYAQSDVREHYRRVVDSKSWTQLVDLENRLVQNAERPVRDVVTLTEWQSISDQVSAELIALTDEQATGAANLALANGERKFNTVLIGSLIALLAVIVGITLAVRISRRLVNKALITRLASLKSDSLKLAHERLPAIVGRLREGKHVDVAVEVPALDYGNDEIGQVADAFNAAQYTAVAAAVKESQAREGVNRVFLDIAHRNQGLVHRQLKILDKLEREEENPEQLDALFQLDHLATRARRNAENLIILAGEQPGRQWRKPVRLIDVLRSAVAETEHYVRVKVNPVPEVAMVGAAVADTIHLIAELVDNATSFSPPRSQVQVHSSEVPQGIVVEIEDHGLGIKHEHREQHNAMLAAPPEFEAMRLRGETRLGLFVVARLAARRGIHVELRESPYGGTLALMLIPRDVVVRESSAVDPAQTTQVPRRAFHEQNRDHTEIPQQGDSVHDDNSLELSRELDDFWARPEAGTDSNPMAANESVSGGAGQPGDARRADIWPVNDPEGAGGKDDRPPLPHRRRQQSLAPQLAYNDFPLSSEPPPAFDAEHTAERVRDGLSAFQKSTRDARRADNALEP